MGLTPEADGGTAKSPESGGPPVFEKTANPVTEQKDQAGKKKSGLQRKRGPY